MDARRRRILADIGIDVWTVRSSPEAAGILEEPEVVEVAAAAAPSEASEPVTPLRFNYVQSKGAICFYGEDVSGIHGQFLRDLVGARAFAARSGKPTFAAGEFRWPIIGSGGEPRKAVATLLSKLEADDEDWLLITQDIAGDVRPHVERRLRIVEIPNIGKLAGDATLKRQLWEQLTRSHT